MKWTVEVASVIPVPQDPPLSNLSNWLCSTLKRSSKVLMKREDMHAQNMNKVDIAYCFTATPRGDMPLRDKS